METEIEIRDVNGLIISIVMGRLADMLMGALISLKQAKISKEKKFVGQGTFKILEVIKDCKFVVNSSVTVLLRDGYYIKILKEKGDKP